jgi:hypothetical protein
MRAASRPPARSGLAQAADIEGGHCHAPGTNKIVVSEDMGSEGLFGFNVGGSGLGHRATI